MQSDTMNEWTVQAFLDALGSDDPVPGGGAVAALAGAAAVALLQMVTSLARRRAKEPAAQSASTALRERAQELQDQFAGLADADVAAYRGVAEVLTLPRSTDEEKARRAERLQRALARAAEVPLDTARRVVETLGLAQQVAPICPKVARSDLVTAVHLLRAACASALANVDANALALDESPLRLQLAADVAALEARAGTLAESLLSPLDEALATWRPPLRTARALDVCRAEGYKTGAVTRRDASQGGSA